MLASNKKASAMKTIKNLKLYLPVVLIMSLSEVVTGSGRISGGCLSLTTALEKKSHILVQAMHK